MTDDVRQNPQLINLLMAVGRVTNDSRSCSHPGYREVPVEAISELKKALYSLTKRNG